MKKGIVLSVLSISLLLSACSSSGEAKLTSVKNGKKIEDIHGVGVANDGTTYVATHEGLFLTKDTGKSWNKVGSMDADLMGFNMRSDGTMLTSGHPGNKTNLPNPIGVLMSKDNGLNWDKVEYVGKIDFHVLTSYHHDPKVIYGLNQMGTGQYGAGIYRTTDGGKKWTKIEPNGLPNDLMKVYSLLVLPENKDTLLAGTEIGVMISKDGGRSWKMFDNTRLLSAMAVMPNGKDIIGYSMSNLVSGLMISQDSGQTWKSIGLDLGKDAASSISINQKDENQIAVSSYNTSLYVTKDGGKKWSNIIETGTLK
ncbi:F510_1955 family glycosylhydrolase [Neobacillus sp. SM06]|uniref:F510_1955 family glycosylhydrolase n=1 Tax=Neobacillus sp. SM06 TaxID=3422492 RepID=UPI003D2C35B1